MDIMVKIMKLILLGTDSPIIDPDRQGPSTLLEIIMEFLLFDCGRGGVTTQINKAHIPLQEIGTNFYYPPSYRSY